MYSLGRGCRIGANPSCWLKVLKIRNYGSEINYSGNIKSTLTLLYFQHFYINVFSREQNHTFNTFIFPDSKRDTKTNSKKTYLSVISISLTHAYSCTFYLWFWIYFDCDLESNRKNYKIIVSHKNYNFIFFKIFFYKLKYIFLIFS